MKYRIGDRVKIRKDLVIGKEYWCDTDSDAAWYYTEEMDLPVVNNGYVGTIIDIINVNDYGYRLDIVPDEPYFNDAMIEGYAEEVELNTKDILQFLEE